MVEGSTCNYFHPMWKPTFRTMVAKVSRTTSWVLVHLLPRMQCKRWIPIGLMGCVQRIHAIKGWGNPSHVRNVVEKTGEDNLGNVVKKTGLGRLVEM